MTGTFFRAVDPGHRDQALSGSVKPGRYSRPDQPTLYLSASVAGVHAAMVAHGGSDAGRVILPFAVHAQRIYDLRAPHALALVQKDAGDPFADWQELLARGKAPPSWQARDWIEAQGAMGLIDPSRKAPGLWHLVLFAWNVPGAPTVRA